MVSNELLSDCEDGKVKPEVTDEVEAFTCLMYGQPRETSVETVCAKMLTKMDGEDGKLTI
jgi:hypothetical protein